MYECINTTPRNIGYHLDMTIGKLSNPTGLLTDKEFSEWMDKQLKSTTWNILLHRCEPGEPERLAIWGIGENGEWDYYGSKKKGFGWNISEDDMEFYE